jgi:hypothetical protein
VKTFINSTSPEEEYLHLCSFCNAEKEWNQQVCVICGDYKTKKAKKFYQHAPGIYKRIVYKVSTKKILVEKIEDKNRKDYWIKVLNEL